MIYFDTFFYKGQSQVLALYCEDPKAEICILVSWLLIQNLKLGWCIKTWYTIIIFSNMLSTTRGLCHGGSRSWTVSMLLQNRYTTLWKVYLHEVILLKFCKLFKGKQYQFTALGHTFMTFFILICSQGLVLLKIFTGDMHRGHCLHACWEHQAQWCSWHTEGKACHAEGPGQAWEVCPGQPHKVKQGQVQGSATGSGQSQAQIWVGGEWRTAWEQP